MLTRRRKWILGLGAAAVSVAVVLAGSASVGAASSTDWSLNTRQVAQARQALMLIATQSNPAAPGKSARVTGPWPPNITVGTAFGTDRVAANAAMGEPKAAPATDTRSVVCAEGHGQFSTADTPRPPGSTPQVFTYAVVCFDPATGNILDTGYNNKPLTGRFNSTVSLDVASAITSTVK
jgi:hypothetical protein